MKQHLNTLFVTTDGAYLAKDGEAVVVRVEREVRVRVPVHNLGGIVCLARVGASPALMGMCAEAGVAITFLTPSGRFLARVSGFTPGNVLLRREQYRRADDPAGTADIARSIVTAKVVNARSVLLRAAREGADRESASRLTRTAGRLAQTVVALQQAQEVDRIRGLEGDAARDYFAVFDAMIAQQKEDFRFTGRNRRPPLDKVNALLSFVYAVLTHDARAAC